MSDQVVNNNQAEVMPPVDAQATVQVAGNKMEASIIISAPQYDGMAMTYEKIQDAVAQKGVIFGIDNECLKLLSVSPAYGVFTVFAKGQVPVNGENAKLKYHIKLERDLRPKENPDGTVNFRDLGLIESVAKDALLCEKIPADPGTPGIDVLGNPLPAKPGKDVTMPMGKNTYLSEDKMQLFAGSDGQVEHINNKVTVLETFTVEGDVSTATGDINFPGNVVIHGGVASGFTVHASGNIDITDIVESANIMAGGNIIIRGGFNGGVNGKLEAAGNITCRYIQGGRITLGENLETSYIINATVNCSGSINLIGKGLIMGGHVAARTSISANILGSATSTATTVVEAGNDPLLFKRLNDIPKEMDTCMSNIKKLEPLINALIQMRNTNKITPERLEQLEKSQHVIQQLRATHVNLKDEHDDVKAKLAESGNGWIKVMGTAYPGVRIVIGAEQLHLHDDHDFTRFSRIVGESGITKAPAG
jgi:hypothetical protein